MPDDDTDTGDPRRTTTYILGQINSKLAGLVDTLGEIKGSLNTQDKRIDGNSERITAVEHRVGSVEEWQHGHDGLEQDRERARQNTVAEVQRRRYTLRDLVVVGSIVAAVGEVVTHLGDMLAYLGEHLH